MSRTRTYGMLSTSWQLNQDYTPQGVLVSGTNYPTDRKANGVQKVLTDTNTPGFRKRQAQGEVMMNSMTLQWTRRACPNDQLSFGNHPSWGKRVVSGPLACQWSVPPTRPAWFETRKTDAAARTLLTAHSRVASEDFMSLVTVAEAGKTARMIASPFSGANDLITRMVNRRMSLVKRGMTFALATASAWNEMRFGWTPLLYELSGIWEAYINGTTWEHKPVRKIARSTDKDIKWVSHGNVTVSTTTPGLTEVRMIGNFDHEAKVSSGVLYELLDANFEDATARRMGLRLSDVPASIWELVPYSFVVDRFVDIGKWLNAIVPKPGVKILGSWTTTVDRQLNEHLLKEAKIYVATAPATSYLQAGGTYSEEIHNVSRIANPSLPLLPTVNYRDLNLVQQIDHLAIIMQRLAGLKHRT